MKTSILVMSALLCLGLGSLLVSPVAAQTYETYLSTSVTNETFDELASEQCSDIIPSGWVMAEGVGMPVYSGPVTSTLTNFTATPPVNFTNYTITLSGGASGCTHDVASPSFGGRINFGDASSTYANRSLGFASSNPSWESPTNDLMYGFYNTTGSNIISLAITNTFKQYRLNSTAATATFYYSYDGTNWTHLSTGDAGPFATGSSSTYYYTTGPLLYGKSFTISDLNIPNGHPFYLEWQLIQASANGSYSPEIGFDDFGLTATYGTPTVAGYSVWTAASGGWGTAANWKGGVLPASGNNLIFAGAGGSSTNNLAAVSAPSGLVTSLVFSNTAGAYTLSGSAINLGVGLTNNSTSTETVNLPINLQIDQAFVAAAGNLVFGGVLSNSSFGLSFAGPSNITVNAAVTGSGSLTQSGTGVALLNASNSYGGSTIISGGTLQVGNPAALPAISAVTVGAAATLNLTNYNAAISALNGSGNVTLGSGTLSVVGTNGSASFGGVISGAGGLSLLGDVLQNITATNLYSGPTWLTNGTLAIANVATLGTGPVVLDGGTLELTGTRDLTNGVLPNAFVLAGNTIVVNSSSAIAGNRNLPFGGPVTTTNGTLTVQNVASGNYTNVMYLRFYGLVTNFSQPILFSNATAYSPVNNTAAIGADNTNGTVPQLYSGYISGPGKFIRGTLALGEGGVAILTGENTFSAGTFVSGGFLGLGADSISSGGVVQSSPVGTGTLEFDDSTVNGLAGVGVFAYGGAHILENRVLLNGVTNTAIIGTNALNFAGVFDVGQLTKTITISNTALTTISGQLTNLASLTVTGSGALELTADNSAGWSGSLNITGGTVLADNTTGTATGVNPVTITGGTLGGTGYVAGAVVATAGAVAPGNSVGILTLEDGVDFSAGGSMVWTLAANSTNAAGASFSQLAVTGGTLNLGGASVLTLQFTNAATAPNAAAPFWQTKETWRIATISGSAVIGGGTFATISDASYTAGTFSTTADANGILLTFTPGTVVAKVPGISGIKLAGNQLSLSVTNGSTGGTYYVLAATNLLQKTWTPLATNTFSGSNVTNTITINPAAPQTFFRVEVP